jgi:hypothetical protein
VVGVVIVGAVIIGDVIVFAVGMPMVVPGTVLGTVPKTMIGGLRPAFVVWVALKGMLAPASVGSLPDAGIDCVLAPASGELVAVQPVNPPPSKAPLGTVGQLVSGIGLKPPELISVAPSGMPDGAGVEIAPGTPRGDVTPIAGAPIADGVPMLCAWTTPESVSIAANVGKIRRMGTLQTSVASLLR